MDIRSAQKHTWENKIEKGFNTTDVPLEVALLISEVGEAFTAWRKNLPDFGEELADITLYTTALAQMNGIDLQAEIERKAPRWHRTPDTAASVPLEFGLLTKKIGDALTAWRENRDALGGELADIALRTSALAQMNGRDLYTELQHKVTKNRGRVYTRNEHGVPIRVREHTPPPQSTEG
ncbi:hypothetical protein ADL21_00560 [Streptomyces albus subsp. albus]|nr:hypothetical protein ADL21_00560 [Streptomyces albus subsp. albus]